jgi:holo-[acyl-carrier protein] synthase
VTPELVIASAGAGARVFGVGIDLVELDELDGMIRRRGARLLSRVFTPAEIAYCEAKHRPLPHFGARLAAKEAAFKALGTGWAQGVSWHDVEVLSPAHGVRPTLKVTGEFARRAASHHLGPPHVSLTHATRYASAIVVLTETTP